MANPATTFRFDEETKAMLESLKDEFQVATLQATVEILIKGYRPLCKQLKTTEKLYDNARHERNDYHKRLKTIREVFSVITDHPLYDL